MKTKTIITELTQEDLVNLLCTATYGSNMFRCEAPDRDGVDIKNGDCLEDVWAKCLLAGKSILVTDLNSDGDGNYGALPSSVDEDGYVTYSVKLTDIINGLQECADGTFLVAASNYNNYGENDKRYVMSCFNTFKENDGGMDTPQAEALMQIIVFGELIYG